MLKDHPTLRDCQEFHRWLDLEKGFSSDLPLNMMLLMEEVGEVAKEVRRFDHAQNDLGLEDKLVTARDHLEEELADCLAYIVKLANYTDIDLEQAYLKKMHYNVHRVWND